VRTLEDEKYQGSQGEISNPAGREKKSVWRGNDPVPLDNILNMAVPESGANQR
jgi:hypothetical protein